MKKILILILFCTSIFADFENAKANLNELAKEFKLEDLKFDENNHCILEINDTFNLYISYIQDVDKLCLFSFLSLSLPKDDRMKLKLYEKLLEGSLFGIKMIGCGVGIDLKEEFILMNSILDICGVDDSKLKSFVPYFVETVEKWQKTVSEICEGNDIIQRVERRNLRSR